MQNTADIRKNSHSKAFKLLQRETSVYKYYVELKEGVLTEQGYLDLAKVPGLYVSGAALYLRNLRKTNNLSRKDIIEIFEVSRSQLTHWEYNGRRIPLKTLVKITETLGGSRDTIYSLINQGKFSLRKATLPVKFEKIQDFVQYLTPLKDKQWPNRLTLHKQCPDETISKIKKTFDVQVRSNRRKWKQIACSELYNFILTFFHYNKVSKIQPPLTNEVKNWYDYGIDLKRAIIIPCLQSDGNIIQSRDSKIRFKGYNKVLHNYFVDAMYYEYNELPSSYFIGNLVTMYYRKSKIINDVMNLAGNTKTSPAGGSIHKYLQEVQPHLNYLINASKKERQIALRIWASTEGCITVSKNEGRLCPVLIIACAHPNLATQLQQMVERLNVNLHIRRSKKYWSGIMGLGSSGISTCINFLKLGGFIKGVKIGATSKYHEGTNKDILLLGILEFKKRELENRSLKKMSIKQAHYEINRIIADREIKSAEYYINHFSYLL